MAHKPTFEEQKRAWQAWWERPFAPIDGSINWRGPNLWIGALLLVCAAISRIPIQAEYFGWMSLSRLTALVVMIMVLFVERTLQSFTKAIDAFVPRTSTEAKRANEQMKLTATLLNASAIGAVGIVTLRELFAEVRPNGIAMVAALGLAYWLHIYARSLMGRLKDENPASIDA